MDEDSAAEEQRSALIDSLLANSTEDDFNGAVQVSTLCTSRTPAKS